MNKSHPFDEYLQKLHQEIASQNRKWLEGVIEAVAEQNKLDVSQLSESVLLNAPDVGLIANEIVAQNAVSSIFEDAAIESVAAPTLTAIIDDCLQKTLIDTSFVEAFLDSFRDGMAANSVAQLCAEKFEEMANRKDVSCHVERQMKSLAEQFETTESFDEAFAELAEQRKFDTELDSFIKKFAAQTDLSSLLAERMSEVCKSLEAFESRGQVMRDIIENTDFNQIRADVREDLNRSYEEAVAKVAKDTEIERFRHLPWDTFIDLTYGSLADDPVERPETIEPGATDSV